MSTLDGGNKGGFDGVLRAAVLSIFLVVLGACAFGVN